MRTKKAKILVCDDDRAIREALKDILLSEGYETVLAENGEDGVSVFKKEIPDLIILDVVMPGISGFEVLEKIKPNFGDRYVPIIFLTASVKMNDKVKALNGGAVDYLIKPVSAEELLARIKNFLEIKEKYDKLKREAAFDWMTGTLNKVYFLIKAKEELEKSLRNKIPLTFILIDIDGLKKINDTLGHLAGDKVIREFTARLKRVVRSIDIIGRFGGDEFMVMLSHKTASEGRIVLERLKKSMKEPILFEGDKIHATCSMGVIEAQFGEKPDMNRLIMLADKALYEAKSNGGNQSIAN